MESDLLEIIEAAMNEDLANIEVKWNKGTCVNVVLASKVYPWEFVKGEEITIKEGMKDKVFDESPLTYATERSVDKIIIYRRLDYKNKFKQVTEKSLMTCLRALEI